MLEIKSITKKFNPDFWKGDFVALKNVNFKIEKGSIVGFLGANGAGKTTLLKIILGFIKPTRGEIVFDEKVFEGSPFSKIGYMPERPYYYSNLTGREFLIYCGKLNDIKKVSLDNAIRNWSEKLKIDYALDRKIGSYSKGMLQRLGFSSCLLHNPELIILDEPLSGLDPIGRKDFKDILVELNKSGITVFFSSHIVSDIEEVCSDVVVLQKGELVFSGNIKEILSGHSSHSFYVTTDNNEKLENLYKDSINQKNIDGTRFLIDESELSKLLKICVDESINVLNVNKETKSLEDIVYKLKELKK